MLGANLGHYRILDKIGEGGMGEVYRARDDKLGRDVAIKVLPEDLVQSRERLDRFEREARLLAQLNHSNIATLHGLEEHDGQPFLVMELVEGETLEERIARGPVPLDEAVPLFVQIAEGLEGAHEKGIIHRDLKPANVKITPDDDVKILDFGLAKAFVTEQGSADASRSPTLTKGTALGVIIGTAAYMSPEQAKGKRVDTRTDVWAFGACLFEALSRQRAFLGETVAETLANVIARDPSWEKLPASLPEAPRRLLRRTLVKNAKERLQHIGDARIELLELDAEPKRAGATENRHWLPWAMAALGIGAALLWTLRPTPNLPEPVRHVEVTTEPMNAFFQQTPAISPDGETIAYNAVNRRGVVRRELGRPVDEFITGADGWAPFFSSDGAWIGYFGGGRLWKIPVTGGVPFQICENEDSGPRGGSWAEDGTIVFSDGPGPLLMVSESGGIPRALTTLDVESNELGHLYPHVLPDKRGVLFQIVRGGRPSLGVFDFETREHRELLEYATAPYYSPSGHVVFERNGAIHAAGLDLETLQLTTDPVTVVNRVFQWPMVGTRAQFALSASGTLVYVSMDDEGAQTERTLVWLDGSGRTLSEQSFDRRINDPEVSPDGERVAITLHYPPPPTIWIAERARDTRTPLTVDFGEHPVWSPDGARVAFTSSRHGGAPNLYWKLADGTGEVERLTTSPTKMHFPVSFSPDGGHLAFIEVDGSRDSDIWLYPIDSDRGPIVFADEDYWETGPDFSPDGRWITYSSRRAGQTQVYATPFPGPGEAHPVSTDGGKAPRWSADGRKIFYAHDGWMMAADVTTDPVFRASEPRALFELDKYELGIHAIDLKNYDVTEDGGFVLIREDRTPAPTKLHVVLNWSQELERLVPTP